VFAYPYPIKIQKKSIKVIKQPSSKQTGEQRYLPHKVEPYPLSGQIKFTALFDTYYVIILIFTPHKSLIFNTKQYNHQSIKKWLKVH